MLDWVWSWPMWKWQVAITFQRTIILCQTRQHPTVVCLDLCGFSWMSHWIMDCTRLLRLPVSTQKSVNDDCELQLSCSSRCIVPVLTFLIQGEYNPPIRYVNTYRGQTVPIECVSALIQQSWMGSHHTPWPLSSLSLPWKFPTFIANFSLPTRKMSACT